MEFPLLQFMPFSTIFLCEGSGSIPSKTTHRHWCAVRCPSNCLFPRLNKSWSTKLTFARPNNLSGPPGIHLSLSMSFLYWAAKPGCIILDTGWWLPRSQRLIISLYQLSPLLLLLLRTLSASITARVQHWLKFSPLAQQKPQQCGRRR